MKDIDYHADRHNGHYVEPKATTDTNKATRSFIADLKKNTMKVK